MGGVVAELCHRKITAVEISIELTKAEVELTAVYIPKTLVLRNAARTAEHTSSPSHNGMSRKKGIDSPGISFDVQS